MRQHLARLAPVLFVGGCSLLYNPSNISKQPIDAAIDSPPDAAIDANPSNLSLSAAAPATIDEGQGDFGSRPAILVLHGSNFISGAQVAITATETIHVDVDNTQVVLSGAADYLAVPVTAHVDPAVPEKTIALTITVTQQANGSPVTQMLAGKLSLQGHAELDASHPPPTDGTALAGIYSKIDLPAMPFTFTGGQNQSVLLRSVSSIAIGAITAKGKNASSGNGGGAGPGGCGGGAGATPGDCDGGGGAASPGTLGGGGGGGAGFATMGTTGMGGGAGGGGPMVGDDMIATYAGFSIYKADHAAGGGGGGGSVLNSAGGGGGGGGGIVELTAGGDIMASTIDTSGGAGSAANGAGGGGGAGGVIMVRAGGTLATGMLKASGGAGGSSGTSSGGPGSDGRIRWDAPTGSAPSATPAPVRGPAFVVTSAVLTTTPSLQLVGTPNHTFAVYWIDDAGQTHTGTSGSFGGGGTATITPSLSRGYSRVCITLMGGQQGTPEADKCIDVAYLP